MNKIKQILILLLLIIICQAASAQIYVNIDAQGKNNGKSWKNAFMDLQDAIDIASSEDEIWVAKGIYFPTKSPIESINPRDKTFYLHQGIQIYGGFSGDETERNQANPKQHLTILSGDFNQDDILNTTRDTFQIERNEENAYHVLLTTNLTSQTVINGFTIQGGNANGEGTIIYHADTLERNYGGGIFISKGQSPTISNCVFKGNCGYFGGGSFNRQAAPIYSHCVYEHNRAFRGGGQYNIYNANVSIQHSIFFNNVTGSTGGGLYNRWNDTKVHLSDCIFYKNTTYSSNGGGAIRNVTYAKTYVTKSIFWENIKQGRNNVSGADFSHGSGEIIISYSLTQVNSDYSFGQTIINNENPMFANPNDPDGKDNIWFTEDDGLQLTKQSPALDGSREPLDLLNVAGLMGKPRSLLSLGEYINSSKYYVHQQQGDDNNTGLSWENAFVSLQVALERTVAGDTIWVAAGTYLPTKDYIGNPNPKDNRTKTFVLNKDIVLVGGFDGSETTLEQANPKGNPTILSGDFYNDDVISGSGQTLNITQNDENAYHVLLTSDLTNEAIISGFTITGGHANGSQSVIYNSKTFNHQFSGGIANITSSPTFVHCIITGNVALGDGGGMGNIDASPIILHSFFIKNIAQYSGGGVQNTNAYETQFMNCIFEGNLAQTGGGNSNYRSSPILFNCIFENNHATEFGGGQYNDDGSDPILGNTIFYKNTAKQYGGGQFNKGLNSTVSLFNCVFFRNWCLDNDIGRGLLNFGGATSVIRNSIFWKNYPPNDLFVAGSDLFIFDGCRLYLHHTLTQEASSSIEGNQLIYQQNPLFVQPESPRGADGLWFTADDGLRLQLSSPAYQKGLDEAATLMDILGNEREYDKGNMGAY